MKSYYRKHNSPWCNDTRGKYRKLTTVNLRAILKQKAKREANQAANDLNYKIAI